MGSFYDIGDDPNKKKSFYDLGEGLTASEYHPTPTRAQYTGTDIGYTSKRLIGGPLLRAIELPQQYVYAGVSAAMGTLPDEWSAGSPWRRVIDPGRFPRITEAAITGTEAFAPNLGVALLLDPINFVGGLGAVTKLGKATKLVKGLAEVSKLGTGLEAIDLTVDALKVAGQTGGKSAIKSTIKNWVGPKGNLKKYAPLWEEYGKHGDTVFDEPLRLSQAIREGKSTVFGVGPTAGFLGEVTADIGKGVAPQVTAGLEKFEDIYQTGKRAANLSRYTARPEAVQKVGKAYEVVEHPEWQRNIARIKEAVTWQSLKDMTRMGIAERGKWLDALYKGADTPEKARNISRHLADVITDKSNAAGNPTVLNAADSHVDLMRDIYEAENHLSDFGALGPDYIRRVTKRTDKGMLVSNEWYNHMIGKTAKVLKRHGWLERLKFKRVQGGDFISVQNSAQFARSEQVSGNINNTILFLKKSARHADEGSAVKNELIGAQKSLLKLKEIYDKGLYGKEMSPHDINRMFRREMGDEITDFMHSKAGRRAGFSADSTLDDFEFFEEDFRKIVPERLLHKARTIFAGDVFGNFLGEFAVLRKLKDSAGKMINNPDFDVANKFAQEAGQKMVNVQEYLSKRLGKTQKSIRNIIGKAGEGEINNMFMDSEAADALSDLLSAFEAVEQEGIIIKTYDKLQNFWARSTLFGGRASYVWNNLTGDRWNMMLAGVRKGKFMSGSLATQVMFDEGKSVAGAGFLKGLKDTDTVFTSANGITYTKKMVNDLFEQHSIGEGLFGSDVFNAVDQSVFAKNEEIRDIHDIWDNMKKGDLVPGFRNLAQFFEKQGRYSLFMHFLEEGRHPAEAAEGVAKYLFDYSKQNKKARRMMPFYYWTWKNTPLQFRNMFRRPGLQRTPTKFQHAAVNSKSPSEDATPEYLQAKGVYYGEHSGKDVWVDLSNIPPMAALEVTALLDTEQGLGNMIQEASKRGASITGPFIQLIPEFATNRDIFTGRPILGGGAGAAPEKGIKEFMGFNIQGSRDLQMAAHVAKTVMTPLDIADAMRRQVREPEKAVPSPFGYIKTFLGTPFRSSNRDSAEWVSLSKQKNALRNQADQWEELGNMSKARKLDREADKIQRKLSRINKKIQARKRREK